MVQEAFDSFSSVHLGFATGVLNTAFLENVVESEGRRHLVELNFLDSNHNVIFNDDIHGAVVLIRHVEKRGVVAQELSLSEGEFQYWGNAVEENDSDVLTSKISLDVASGQKRRREVQGFTAVILQVFAQVVRVSGHNGAHELFNAVENVGTLN